ncbi:MAG TPA: hypothetical protein VNW97_00490 [Candidatus Saccharimonadales bacterium]|jgi:hypothetical protein|nr:hypothetical protein [Candidatus Saccharimonadales bacterium]
MSQIWRTIKGYIFWTYERGSFHYDVMVTLILAFIFVTPHLPRVNFKDQPAEGPPHPTGITVFMDGDKFIYRVDASMVDAHSEGTVRASLLRAIEPISGNVVLLRAEPVRDPAGRLVAYRAVVRR